MTLALMYMMHINILWHIFIHCKGNTVQSGVQFFFDFPHALTILIVKSHFER